MYIYKYCQDIFENIFFQKEIEINCWKKLI